MDAFVLASGTFSILAAIPLIYLAVRSVRDAKDFRLIQHELTDVVRETKELAQEVHALQCEIRREQQTAISDIDETLKSVQQQVAETVETAVDQVAEVAVQVVEVAESRRWRPWRRKSARIGLGIPQPDRAQ
jgi:hypothetical protein